MGLIQEFRDFAIKGNVLDLAVAVIIGAAFGKIVDSVVKDLLTPVIPTGVAGQSFADFKLGQIAVGNFINNVISFLIVAFILFLIVKAANRFKKPVEAPVDLAALNVEQNKEIIALLKQIADKPRV